MIAPPAGTRIWIAAGVTDMRRGFDGLAALVQTQLEADPFSGQSFAFRGRRGDRIKLLWWDGDGLCLFCKRLEQGRFVWPQAISGSVPLTWFAYSPDRKGQHPRAHLKSFSGILQADGYAGFAQLYAKGTIQEAACWAHARRKFYDVYKDQASPLASEALQRITTPPNARYAPSHWVEKITCLPVPMQAENERLRFTAWWALPS